MADPAPANLDKPTRRLLMLALGSASFVALGTIALGSPAAPPPPVRAPAPVPAPKMFDPARDRAEADERHRLIEGMRRHPSATGTPLKFKPVVPPPTPGEHRHDGMTMPMPMDQGSAHAPHHPS